MGLQPSVNLDLDRYQYAEQRLQIMAQEIGAGTVYDIGAGACEMRAPAESAGFVWRGFDLDPSSDAVVRWDLDEACPVREQADVAIMLDVIEHLFNPGLGMKNVAAALRPGGRLLATMPNPCWSRARVHHLLYGTLAAFTEHDLKWNHHVFAPFPHIIERLLNDAEFEIEDYVTLDGVTRWPKPKLSLSYPFLCAEALGRMALERRDGRSKGFSYAFLARRR